MHSFFALLSFAMLTIPSFAGTSIPLFENHRDLRFPVRCHFIENHAYDSATGLPAGHFGSNAALGANEIEIRPFGKAKIKLMISNGPNVPQTIWFGSLALCRSQSRNEPLQNSLCFDMEFSNHSQPYDGQYVLSDSLLEAGAALEIHSVGTRSVPTSSKRVDVSDRYWCEIAR